MVPVKIVKDPQIVVKILLEEEKNNNETKTKMKGNGKLFFSVYSSLEAVSLEQKSTVFGRCQNRQN